MSKFDGKFRKNKDYQEDNEIASNFVKIKKRTFDDPDIKKSKPKQPGSNHKHYVLQDGWDG